MVKAISEDNNRLERKEVIRAISEAFRGIKRRRKDLLSSLPLSESENQQKEVV